MILTILKIILDILYPFALAGMFIYLLRRGDKLEKQIKKLNVDINSLHRNQQVLVSNLKVIQNDLRKHDKRKLKLRFGGEKTRTEESGQGRNDGETAGSV